MFDQPTPRKMPKYSGTVRTAKEKKKLGTIMIWENESANPKAPILSGTIKTNYGSSLVALWPFTPKKRQEGEQNG